MGKPFAPVVYPQAVSPSRLPKVGGGVYSSCTTAVFCLVRRWFVGARKAAVGPLSTGCSRIGSGKVRANCKYGPDSRPKRRAVPPPGGDAQAGTGCRVPGMVKSCAPELFMQPRVCALVPLGLGLKVGRAPPSGNSVALYTAGRSRFNAQTPTGPFPPRGSRYVLAPGESLATLVLILRLKVAASSGRA